MKARCWRTKTRSPRQPVPDPWGPEKPMTLRQIAEQALGELPYTMAKKLERLEERSKKNKLAKRIRELPPLTQEIVLETYRKVYAEWIEKNGRTK